MSVALVLGGYGFAAGLTSDEYPNPGWVTAVLIGLAGLALAARRVRPTPSFLVAMGAPVLACLLYGSFQAGSSLLIALVSCYSAAAYGVNRPVVAAVVMSFAVVVGWGPLPSALGSMAFVAIGCAFAAAGGLVVRRTRELSAANVALRELVQMEAAARTQAAVDDERARVARELHDILSHSLGAVVLQTSAAQHAWTADPQRAHEAVVAAHDTAVEAVGQLRTLLSVVRENRGGDRATVPTINDLHALAARSTAGGFRVGLQIEGEPRPVPPAVQASVYRVAQEGIANSMKHSGAPSCLLRLKYTPDSVLVEVEDDGEGATSAGTRLGLAGIRERTALFGGSMDAGPRPSGGWGLHVEFPL